MPHRVGEFSFDSGLDFAATRAAIVEEVSRLRTFLSSSGSESEDSWGWPEARFSHWIIFLIQLVNGARISEAVDAFDVWMETGAREVEVRVRKTGTLRVCSGCGLRFSKKSRRGTSFEKHQVESGHQGFTEMPDPESRLVIIPDEVLDSDKSMTIHVGVGAAKKYATRTFIMNSHSLRYALVSELSRRGTAPQIIARVTGHRTLALILRYTGRREGERVLRELAAEGTTGGVPD